MGSSWPLFSTTVNLIGACASLTVGAWLVGRRERFGVAGPAIITALLMTALWSLSTATQNSHSVLGGTSESLRDLAYLAAVYRLFAMDGRHTSLAPVRPVMASLIFVSLLQALALILASLAVMSPAEKTVIYRIHALLGLLEAMGSLVLVHNLFAGASLQARTILRWPAAAFALMWLYDLNLYTLAYLDNIWSNRLNFFNGLIALCFAALLALGADRNRAALKLRPSRVMAFHTFSLLLIGAYMIAMASVTQWLAIAGGDLARYLQYSFLIIAGALALLLLPSRQMRGWLRVSLLKHFFQHRYDYRAEWLRFTRTIGGQAGTPLAQRVIQAVADITDSPAGLLLTPEDGGNLQLAARWQWPTAQVPAIALGEAAIHFLEHQGFIVELDTVRSGTDEHGEGDIIPAWLRDEPRAWALVPLLHYDRLVGVVVLAQPAQTRSLDWEDFDLLRVIGQQLASYLAEHAGQEALAEASRFDDFNRRIAFVMHDIKNLASQQSLLARNAELHADKAEFRADMLVTLRNSAEKLNTLIARLSRYGGAAAEQLGPVDVKGLLKHITKRFMPHHAVQVIEASAGPVIADSEKLEQVLVHLIQNAIDASPAANPADYPVLIALRQQGDEVVIEIADKGHGMSAEFVRSKLFKPFETTKQGGFGIGAYEARELVRAMHGRLEVVTHEGLGSRFTIILPLAAAQLQAKVA